MSTSPKGLERQRMDLPSFDAEEPCITEEPKNLTEELVDNLGTGLEQVEKLLQNLEDNPDLLGPAILRKCDEFADGVGQVVNELERHTGEQRLLLADACQQDCAVMAVSDPNTVAISQNDWVDALSGAAILLKDVQSAFRDVGADDAEEIADVTLVVARMFLMSLQSFHSSIDEQISSHSARIEEISENERGVGELSAADKDDEFAQEEDSSTNRIGSDETSQPTSAKSRGAKSKSQKRVRVLWPPLGPHVAGACNWGKEEATKKPILAVALGIVLFPTAVATTLVGGGILLADNAIQGAYNHFQETSVIETVEVGASHLYHSSRLLLVAAKFTGRQTLRVVGRQVDRHGGVGKIAQNSVGFVVDRALHPIETAGMAWDGLTWGFGVASDSIQLVMEQKRDQRVMEQEVQ
ncbi:unnamed protein product [Cylindrotheca closterium]|uniref:Uncharacterized protein n=1 Tax=Cylindrotheca closterium TaxID=2856 RepID=A0AAD2G075_9STRA|nr:unnamed protein product [Cylindrotheca closterium]